MDLQTKVRKGGDRKDKGYLSEFSLQFWVGAEQKWEKVRGFECQNPVNLFNNEPSESFTSLHAYTIYVDFASKWLHKMSNYYRDPLTKWFCL